MLETGGTQPKPEGFAVSPVLAYGRRAVKEGGERERVNGIFVIFSKFKIPVL